MGTSTDANLCFGVVIEEMQDTPWDDVDMSAEEWFEDNVDEENPPVALVNYCSDSHPVYILAVPRTVITASRGYPVHIDVKSLEVSKDDILRLENFCEQHNISYEEPRWWLSSYWEA